MAAAVTVLQDLAQVCVAGHVLEDADIALVSLVLPTQEHMLHTLLAQEVKNAAWPHLCIKEDVANKHEQSPIQLCLEQKRFAPQEVGSKPHEQQHTHCTRKGPSQVQPAACHTQNCRIACPSSKCDALSGITFCCASGRPCLGVGKCNVCCRQELGLSRRVSEFVT